MLDWPHFRSKFLAVHTHTHEFNGCHYSVMSTIGTAKSSNAARSVHHELDEDEDVDSNYADSADEYDLDELGRRVDDVISLFTHGGKTPIQSDDLGRIMRCLRINATQATIKEIAIQYAAADGKSILSAQLKPRLISCMQDDEFKAPNEKRLETAFRAIEAQFGQLTKEQLESCLTSDGEALSAAEFDEMLNHLPTKKPNLVDWSCYVRDFMYMIGKKL